MQSIPNTFSHSDTMTYLPPKTGRYIVFDTETTGLEPKENNIIEIAGIEIINGKLTGNQFHAFFYPRYKISETAEEKHRMSQNFFKTYYKDVYESDKKSFENFLNFVGHSLIFAHNAIFDMKFLNSDLKYYGLPQIPRKKFRCSLKIFKNLVKPNSIKKKFALDYCCEYFKLTAPKDNFHSAIFDAFMTARVICCLFGFNNKKENYNNISSENHILINEKKNNLNYALNEIKTPIISPYKSISVSNGSNNSINSTESYNEKEKDKLKNNYEENNEKEDDEPISLNNSQIALFF